jgi:hypothetical protein
LVKTAGSLAADAWTTRPAFPISRKRTPIMANGDKKHFGKGSQGKGSGSGAMIDLDDLTTGENDILSNRDKKQHSKERGQDGNAIKTEQRQDHAANRRP